jgi:pimeloyl-ACP methyl ester carboxylesterase
MTAPVLLLIPGMLNDARLWAGVAAGLRAHADLRIADVSTQASIADMADDAWARIADVPAKVPCVLAGFSLGGYVAIEMLARPRRTWRAAALLSTSCLPESPEGAAGREKAIAAFTQDFEGTLQGIARRGVSSANPELHEPLCQMMRAVGAEAAIRQTRAIMTRSDHRAALGALQLPVLVLCGEQDRITPPALSEALAAAIPGAQLRQVNDAGHMLPLEQPGAVVTALNDWLN